MSLLTTLSRAGPSSLSSSSSLALLPCTSNLRSTNATTLIFSKNPANAKRHKGNTAQRPPVKQNSPAGYLKRDNKSNRWRKALLQFRPLPASQLNHPLFNPETEGKLDVPSFDSATISAPDSVGKPFEIRPPEDDPMRVFGLPRALHFEFRILTKPYTVVRQITKDAVETLSLAKEKESKESRVVLTGRAGTGKSFVMLQAVEHCVQDGWIVVYIPRAINLVNSTTPYTYDLRTQTYLQPAYSFQLLQRMLTVNRAKLAKVPLSVDLIIERSATDRVLLNAGTKLDVVVEQALGERARTMANAPVYLEGVMKALEAQTEFPVLLAVDEFQALYGKSAYKDPHFLPIQPYHLSVPRLIMEYANGKRSFARGAFLSALSLGQAQFPLPLELSDALSLDELHAYPISPYAKRNPTMLSYTDGLTALQVPELTLEEATGIFEVWKGRKAIGRTGTFFDEMLLAKYTESAGNARDFVWKGLLNTLDV